MEERPRNGSGRERVVCCICLREVPKVDAYPPECGKAFPERAVYWKLNGYRCRDCYEQGVRISIREATYVYEWSKEQPSSNVMQRW